ncbi:GrpB family protein [Maridesulfovibrio sp.]|uniref:GrpB family protein n=1 Tax=Maridesulfovibrio sp. TaxID=2795000 RepID=UPI002A18D4AC|nr:GrpB family protein [Maridesulfovibrio sp.]
MAKETLEQKIKRVTGESVEISEYDPVWQDRFAAEEKHLRQCLPAELIIRIEHFGSTSVSGLAAKPIVDMVIEVTDEDRARQLVPEILEPQGYDCFWRPRGKRNEPPYFTWCIKRNNQGIRTHHLHFGRPGFKDAELQFRDILRSRPDVAADYAALKIRLSREYGNDRINYTDAKGEFIQRTLESC